MNADFEVIADGLAEQGYAVVDQFLSQHEVEAILQVKEFNDNRLFKKAGIGNSQSVQIQEGIRGDYIQWLDKSTAKTPIKVYLDKLDALTRFLNQALFLSLKDFEVHIARYPVGTFYKRHLDQFKQDDHRKLSVICYLNTNWKEEHGGQLRMYLPEGPKDIYPLAGRLVCFRSDQLEHEVLPAIRERVSITGWMLDKIGELKHL
ncbi:MAG TPA: 2OG-Fe(II) oxygenase [Cyclobacteriaceae bacterium]|nr:2OG-Fe(II) oxygenase [Cyclobacteriaceae bacterium]HRJ80379.1 2OG-Fe(II) oxygenase [Cyclobacteriaceae bacterium]